MGGEASGVNGDSDSEEVEDEVELERDRELWLGRLEEGAGGMGIGWDLR